MKRFIFLSLIGLAMLITSGCGIAVVQGSGEVISESRQVSDFSNLTLALDGEVILTQGKAESLTIEAQENLLGHIVTEVRGDTLWIGHKTVPGPMLRTNHPIKFYVSMPDIHSLKISGSGSISTEQIETSELTLKVSGSGDLVIGQLETTTVKNNISGSGTISIDALTATQMDTKISGSGRCNLSGTVLEQGLNISGSGRYYTSELESQQLSAVISGSGDAWVWVTEKLDARILGSGDIFYLATPEINSNISGSGEVIKSGS